MDVTGILTKLRDLPTLFKKSFSVLQKNNPLLLASATAFFTVFATTPIIIIVVNILSLYFKSDRISDQLFVKVESLFGATTASQLYTFVVNFRELGSSGWITILGSVFLLFVATTLFNVIKQALNQVWNIRINPTKKLKYNLRERARAFIIILLGGILFMISILFDTLVNLLRKYLDLFIPQINAFFVQAISGILSLIVVSTWFALIFRYIPDARTKWPVLSVGAVITGFFFTIGKYLLGIFLVNGNIGDVFDASASIILFLLFVFYSSMIMYFGAAFTLVYGDYTNRNIKPKKYAERYEKTAIKEKEIVELTKEAHE